METVPAYLPEADYLSLKKLFKDVFKHKPVKVIVFGSRATGEHNPDSDLDLVLCSDKQVKKEMGKLRQGINKTNLNTEVELLDYKEVAPATLQRIQQEGKVFWENGRKKEDK